ncbi:MAG: glycerophosphodiester phosphodiesterase family protein [Pseudomonadota bacterium]
MTRCTRASVVCISAIAALWLNNTSVFTTVDTEAPLRLIAHRGVHHVYTGTQRGNDTCRASQVEPITHGYIENTVPSMEAAFAAGAAVVEVDVHLTVDGVFAVFHDWTLDCQTDGHGVTRSHRFDALARLDLGFRITADGETFPLRGQGVGLMPRLDDVLARFPGRILINLKSRDAREGRELAKRLNALDGAATAFAVYGGGPPVNATLALVPGLRGFDKRVLVRCWGLYALVGWSGWVPPACRDRLLAIPLDMAPMLWGWPHRLTARLRRAGSELILWGPYDGSGFSSGIDDRATLDRVPTGFGGFVWTNTIERIGPARATGATEPPT